jgi:serine/threonine protein kinase
MSGSERKTEDLEHQLADPFEDTPYSEIRRLGRGASAGVFEVEDRKLGKRFVAKLLHTWLADDPQVVERMLREGRALAKISHPHLVEIVSSGYTDGGLPYLIMERLIGCDLRGQLKNGPLPLLDALQYCFQALSALHCAHCAGIVHRDIKPENIFLHRLPSGEVIVKILDLGLAKIRELGEGSRVPEAQYPTEEGERVGTPHYMAPEQIEGGEAIDGRADVYSLGVVLYELLAGSGPFDHYESASGVLQAHLHVQPEPLSKRSRRRIPRALELAVMKAMAKDPRQRFQSAAELEEELARIYQAEQKRILVAAPFILSAVLAGALTFGLLWSLFPLR